ncbi:ABC-2 family transporter protein [Desertifilum sp. FACHB-1129]|uniref:Multidrug ABC transporter permease n=1 Tax=Desertifilum tharense IPPAS B-1220 TaxID=1781255 RepID=A0A1E5QG93_9CYAN|nr:MULTISPECIES: ABC-2 family transporter protein [Desertifilum]MDA0211955.1 ABC-2 family transporter protein [Cyanobacteria bacterium FC1]MBD2312328.1 ABC-2 family transporter protein [Desertifilum sp. FACHB-1129]MBD2325114.1 ABC-2 family transporter protein [Desertifilum sp. FACHB-866]MBD2335191.1 ABC-2 family transporter protein [Desertifilum sp. FACHB-868]OEJ73706.1 multidrug ABC transporter permease [Desertifilum tharense IPPAS B-1220]
MSRILEVARALLVTYYAYMLEYRAELLLWALSGSLPLILMGVWVQAAQEGTFGLSPLDFIRYFLAVFMVRQFTVVWVIWEFEKEVIQGKLSPLLLQPIDPVWRHVAAHLGERVARLPFALGLLILFFVLYPQALWLPPLRNIILFLVSVAIAFALRFLMQYTFALLAFWTERASAIEQFWFFIYLFLSGIVAPLDVFPPTVRLVVEWTPFPYLVYFPAALLVGLPVNLLQASAVIVGWGSLFFVLNRWLWRKGLKHYSGMGA